MFLRISQSLRSAGVIVHDEDVSRVDSTSRRRIGRYELCTRIASGGMASVYFGRIVGSEGFSRVVAIKRMHPHLTESADFRAMFIDEARLAARINHPNVAQIIDLVAEDDELLLVMSYVHGVSVGGLLQAHHGPLRVPVALRIAIDALYGLHAAHTARDSSGAPLEIVHRDVSPQNLLTSVDGVTLVVDFGVAKAAARLQTSREGELKGKIRYMPPEQNPAGRGRTDDRRLRAGRRALGDADRPSTLLRSDRARRPGAGPRRRLDAAWGPRGRDPGRGRGHRHARPRARPLDAVSVRAGDGRGPRGAGARGQPSRRGGRRERAGADDAGGPRGRHAAHPRQCIGRGHRAAAGGRSRSRMERSAGVAMAPGRDRPLRRFELPIGPGVDERQKEAGSRGTRAVVLLAATAGAMTCVAAIVALANRGSVPTGTAAGTMAAAPPGQSATPPDRATAALPSAVPSLAQIANATASGVAPQVSAAPAASTRRASATLAPTAPVPPAVTPPRPPRPRPAPTLDCAQNPRVLGPDGVYQVRKECLGR